LASRWPGHASAQKTVAARVDGQPIYASQVERTLAAAVGQRQIDPAARSALREQTVKQLIDRELILAYLEHRKIGASDQDVRLALSRIERQLRTQDLSLDQYLQRAEMGEAEFRRTLAWQIGWSRYLEKYLTDANLQKYFDQHRRHFDGTRVRAAHILFRVQPRDDPDALSAATAKAQEVLRQIRDGQVSFAEAARRYSAAPTATEGGSVGIISRREPMPERFSQAAFELDRGGISEPTVTSFGVHLILCQEILPGEKSWEDARGELRRAVTEYLFRWVADQQRPHCAVERNSQ
jgi:parvulin-like peptidyl-prolyl isomerase